MKKDNPLKLQSLQITSFMTDVSEEKTVKLRGGAVPTKHTDCWTYCGRS